MAVAQKSPVFDGDNIHHLPPFREASRTTRARNLTREEPFYQPPKARLVHEMLGGAEAIRLNLSPAGQSFG
jgi:hypothetical protein